MSGDAPPRDCAEALARVEPLFAAAADYRDALARIEARMPPGYAYVFAVWYCDSDICDGGFRQLFGGSAGSMAVTAVRGLRRMGRPDVAELIAEALILADDESGVDLPLVTDGFLDHLLPRHRDFADLEDTYYRVITDHADHSARFRPLIDRYIRSQPEDFERTADAGPGPGPH